MASQRKRTWRNALVAAINAGLEQGIFGLGPSDNFWLDQFENEQHERYFYRFSIADIPVEVSVSNINFGELAIHVAFWPTMCNPPFPNLPTLKGLVEARGWLERLHGTYLQTSYPWQLRARHAFGRHISQLAIDPMGFDDHGPLRI